MIKKALMTAALAGCMTVGAHANIFVDVFASEGFFMGPTDGGGFLGAGDTALIQLWFAGDGQIDDLSLTGTGTGASTASAGVNGAADVWLLDFVFSFDSTPSAFPAYAFFDAGQFLVSGGGAPAAYDDGGANTITPGTSVVYGRIYEDGNADAGDWFFATDGLVINDLNPAGTPPPTPDTLDLNLGGGGTGNGDSISDTAGQSFQVVPEPGTIALFGLGILTLIGARRKRS